MDVRNKIWMLVLLICINFSISRCGKSSQQKAKSVTTLIEAKWPATPYLLETCEYLAEEAPELMWSFIEEINKIQPDINNKMSEKDWYNILLERVTPLVSTAQVSILKLALSMRVYSPRIEMYSQMAHERGVGDSKCPNAAADVGGNLVCNHGELEAMVISLQHGKSETPDLYHLDHHYRTNVPNNSVPVVLYAELGTQDFTNFHTVLRKLAKRDLVDYVLRHYNSPEKRRRSNKLLLSGYGVELQIKSTEYKVQDDSQVNDETDASTPGGAEQEEADEVEGFNFGRLKTLYPDKTAQLLKLRQHLIDSNSDLAPLKAWQLQELSLQAAERVMSSPTEEALRTFNHIAHNFPLQARSLVRTAVSPDLRKEVKKNQEAFLASLSLQPSDSALFLNGLFFDVDTLDAGALLEAARSELRTMEGLYGVGVKQHQMAALLALDFISPAMPSAMGASSSLGGTEYALDIRDSAVMWVNDIENDKQYRRWSESLMELLRPTFPGMLRSVRKNIYNLVLVVDPSHEDARPLLRLAESFLVHQAPLHVGVVFAVDPSPEITGKDNVGVALLEAYNYAAENGNAQQGLSLITDVYASATDEEPITMDLVESAFTSKFPKADAELVFGADSQYDFGRKLAKEFVDRSGFRKLPKVLLNGIPLPSDALTSDTFEESVLTEIMAQTPSIQRAVYKGELTDKDDVLDYLMSQPNVMPRLNDRILDSKSQYLDMSGKVVTEDEPEKLSVAQAQDEWWPSNFDTLSVREQTAQVVHRLGYVTLKETAATHPLTLWLVADVDTAQGRNLVIEALENMQSTSSIRLSILANPSSTPTQDSLSHPVTRMTIAAIEYLTPIKARNFLLELMKEQVAEQLTKGDLKLEVKDLEEDDLNTITTLSSSAAVLSEVKSQAVYCQKVLGLPAGSRGVIANGRILGPLEDGELLNSDDFALLDKFSMAAHTDRLQQALKKADEAADDAEPVARGRKSSDLLLRLVALLVSRPQTRSRFEVPFVSDQFSVVKLEPKNKEQPTFDISVIVDPVSRGAQKVGPILSVLYEALNCRVKLFLNAAEKHSDMPLKSFYRYVLEPEPQFTADGKLVAGPIARFINMPQSVLLTQNMHPPENWLVEAVRSPYDLDNIRLEDVMSSVHSEFELSSLLLEGHCSETATGTPPRGLQVTLGTKHDPVIVDTIVMANLGYFQLKANPGAWLLRLRQGRSADIFDIVSVDGSDSPKGSTDQHVLISSLKSHVLKLKVAKKPDQMGADLLAEEEPPTLWNSITRAKTERQLSSSSFWSNPLSSLRWWWDSTFGQGSTGSPGEETREEERINIFSLASGHLYERFIRIMMLSVLKHTKSPVKFWFLKNYLSPTFKDFLPHMAKEYGFEYALVEYKWPRWLHQQTEKQRIIWGYKILFLDVLFPLDVKKIIFVDADQVVRADLKELRDLDLGGAPYGYTPFCESRTEMDGFRFWKQGYWRNHLQGRKYHISALYVVDLRKFRRVAAGDRLRGQYQALSQDPNSLSNLDQDLPNNMIHQVAIKSLPQEWLWCETWCDDQSKAKAKTIDLCNNPLTKEAKLTAAMRILPEWQDYDNEIKLVQERINSEHHHQKQETKNTESEHMHQEL